MKKLLELLSRLGIMKYGAAAGTYRNAAEAPLDFEYMNMSRNKGAADLGIDADGVKADPDSLIAQDQINTPIWLIIVTWVLATLFWLLALGAFLQSDGMTSFWMTLAGLVTAHHTNKLLAVIGVDLSPPWRVVVVVVCLLAIAF